MDLGSISGIGSGTGAPLPVRKPGRKPKVDSKAEGGSSERSLKLDSVRDRMRSGHYQSNEVDEAISDKLSGTFDKLA